jgi:hypothetical protein
VTSFKLKIALGNHRKMLRRERVTDVSFQAYIAQLLWRHFLRQSPHFLNEKVERHDDTVNIFYLKREMCVCYLEKSKSSLNLHTTVIARNDVVVLNWIEFRIDTTGVISTGSHRKKKKGSELSPPPSRWSRNLHKLNEGKIRYVVRPTRGKPIHDDFGGK